MSTVAGAVTKGMADPASSGLLAKANTQDSDAGGFARALGDAGDEGSTSSAPVETDNQGQSTGGGQSASTRFSALSGLASLGQQLQPGSNPSPVQPGAQPPQTNQALPDTQQAAPTLLQPGDLQPAPQAIEQLPPQVIKPGDQVKGDIATPSNLTGEETASTALDLAKLAAAIATVKRPMGTSSEGGKERADASSNPDAQSDADASASGASSTEAASAEALLQLVANTPLNTAPEASDQPTSMGSTQVDQMVGGVAADVDALAMPGISDDADTAPDLGAIDGDAAAPSNMGTFRFQKAGDAAVAASLSITRGDSGGVELQESAGDIQKPETITVLDSRRYLGFGMGANASNLLSAASGDREWSAAMHPAASLSNAASASSTGSVVNTLKLQLTPDHLGTVTANMRLQGDELSIHLTVHNAAAYRELSDDSRPMLEALRAQGFNVDQVTVSLSSASDPNSNSSSGQPQANSNSQGQQQQLQRDGEAGRQQAQGQGQSSGRAASNDMETPNETAQAPVRGSGSAGNLYL